MDFIDACDRVYIVEQNRDGQMLQLLKMECNTAQFAKLRSIRHYVGLPIDDVFGVALRPVARGGRRRQSGGGRAQDLAPGDARWQITNRSAGRRGQEALQITQPVAAIAARVDAVVAQPPRVAPGPHRVRMHAEQACSLGHGQRGIDGAIGEGGRHPGSDGSLEEM